MLTRRPSRYAALVLGWLLGACGPSEPTGAPRVPLTLPPPIAGSATRAPAPPVDPAAWELPAPADASRPLLRALISQGLAAELDPCGCPGSPTGGLARRATFVARARRAAPDLVVIEGPDALGRAHGGVGEVSDRDRDRAHTALRALGVTRPAALFPGQADLLVLPPAELVREAGALGIPVVATNLLGPFGHRRFLRTVHGGRAVVWLGLLGAPRRLDAQSSPRWDLGPAVAEALSEAGPADLVVGLTDAGADELSGWLDAGLPVDVILAPVALGERGDRLRVGRTEVLHPPTLGRSFLRLDALLRPGGLAAQGSSDFDAAGQLERRWSDLLLAGGSEVVEQRAALADLRARRERALEAIPQGSGTILAVQELLIAASLPEEPAVTGLLGAYVDRWVAELQAVVRREVGDDLQYAGNDPCVACHAPQVADWARSPHAGAWQTLRERGQIQNPECLRCHTTGYGEPGGFVDPTADRSLLNVQCEACHGPMLRHVQIARRGAAEVPPEGQTVTARTCLRCHDAANDPGFDPAAFREAGDHRP